MTICTDKAHAYRRVIREINHRYDPHLDSTRHADRKWRNNLIESSSRGTGRAFDPRELQRHLKRN